MSLATTQRTQRFGLGFSRRIASKGDVGNVSRNDATSWLGFVCTIATDFNLNVAFVASLRETFSPALRRCERLSLRRARSVKGPPENYGNSEHTTVAAFLPWRGSRVGAP